MGDSSTLQNIFFIAGILLTTIALYLVVLKRKYRIPGLMISIVAMLYIGMSFLLFSDQDKLDKLNYEASKQHLSSSSIKLVIGPVEPIKSSSTAASKFLDIPIIPVQKINILPASFVSIQASPSTPNLNSSNQNRTQTNNQDANLKITASVDNPNPKKGQKINLLVNGPAGTNIKFVCHYKTKDTPYSGTIGADGTVKIPFDIGTSTPGYEVKVDVKGSLNGSSGSAQTSFTATN